MAVLFISYYTDNYAPEAERLVASLDRFELPHEVTRIRDRGGWDANVRYKPTFIRDVMQKHPEIHVFVWLDADSEIKQFPKTLVRFKGQIGVRFFYWRKRFKSEVHLGDLVLRNSEGVQKFLDLWIAKTDKVPQDTRCPEQESFYDALLELRPDVWDLPEAYCHVLTEKEKRAIIVQHQRSRQEREPEKRVEDPGGPQRHSWRADPRVIAARLAHLKVKQRQKKLKDKEKRKQRKREEKRKTRGAK